MISQILIILPNTILFKPVRYANDTNILFSSDNISDLCELMNSELKKLSYWLAMNKLTLNIDKYIIIIIIRFRFAPGFL